MNNKLKYVLFALLAVAVLSSCKDEDNNGGGGTIPPGSSLQASSPFTIGMATDYGALNASNYLQTAVANASQTTFSYAMMHGAIVQEDGSFNFAMPDAQYAAVTAQGLNVWGHALCGYQNNADYLNTVVSPPIMPNLLPNADFEDWDGSQAVNWNYLNGDGTYGNFTQGTGGDNVQSGSSSMSMDIIQTVTSLGSSWRFQLGSSEFPTVVGHEYKVTFWAKTSTGGCVAQWEWDHDGTPMYGSGSLTTDWQQYTFTFPNADGSLNPLKATKTSSTIAFDMAFNPEGAIIYLDNIVVTDLTEAEELANALSSPEQRAALVDAALHEWIDGVVTHYKGKVTGWDVVTDLFTDDGSIRTNANTSTEGHSDWFVWSEYLGRNTGVAAFNYARAADPNALLFISDYGLESNMKKLDALIEYVQWLQGQGVPVDGIGVKMHISINTAKAGIDYMFQKLAATGLKIRISELDVSVNNVRGFVLTPQVLGFQSTTYHDVVSSYLQYVPAAQRQDITIWGVNDGNSWLYNNGTDFPLLFDDDYAPKPAYGGFLNALKGQ